MARARPRDLRRRFVTPEGVDLQLELGSAGTRAAAFLIDVLAMVVVLIAATIALGFLFRGGGRIEAIAAIWLLGAFLLRNGWFVLFELGGRGATPGKRLMGLRLVARDGARLTGSAVVVRNAMREVEVFLPLTFLVFQTAEGSADAFLAIFALGWSAIFLLFPLFNRDRLRLGDVVAGTWVVRTVRRRLADELGAASEQRRFSARALAIYGEYELQALAEVLRSANPDSFATVAAAIREKAGLADDDDDERFLQLYYRDLCADLERRMMLGKRRPDKHHRSREVAHQRA